MSSTAKDLILYLSYDGLTDPLGQSQILPYLLGLEQKGYQFTIISFEKVDRLKEGKARIHELIGDRKIEWIPMKYHKRPPVLSTLVDVWAMRKAARKVVTSKQVQIVHCRSYIAGLVGMWLKQRLGIKFLFDIRGFWADERVDGELWKLSNPVYRIIYSYFKRKEAQLMTYSDHIISLTEAGKNEIVSGRLFRNRHAIIDPKKLTVIPCAVDLDLFNPQNINGEKLKLIKGQLALSDKDKVLIYLGSVGTWYLLEEMLIFFKRCHEVDSAYKFLILTKDSHELVQDKAMEFGIDIKNLMVTEASREDIPYYVALADLGIFFIKPTYSKKASSATKLGEYLAMGLQVVTNGGVGDIGEAIRIDHIGSLINTFDYKIDQVLNDISKKKANSRDLAFKHFALEKCVSSYNIVYQQISS